MFDGSDFDGFLLVISQFNDEGLVDPPFRIIALEVDASPLACKIKGVASVNADRFTLGGVVNEVLSGELELRPSCL